MANERFSIVEHLDWTNGKISLYGTLHSLFNELTDAKDQYQAELDNIKNGTFSDTEASTANLKFNDSDSDLLYGNNKTVRVFFEEMPVLGVTEAAYNEILSESSTIGSSETPANSTDISNGIYLKKFEPHINLKKNQEIGVYISPLVDMRTPIKDFVNIFDPGSSTSNVYYRSTINPPKVTPDYIIEPDATTSQSFLIPDKYAWRPDSFNHPLQKNMVHTWPLHYEDTYLDDVQSGRHMDLSSSLITLRKETDLNEWISSLISKSSIDSMISEASIGSGNDSLQHIMDFHWVVNKEWDSISKKFVVSTNFDRSFDVNNDLNPFEDDKVSALKTFIPKPQNVEDLMVKMFNAQYPDLNGHLLNYYDNVGDNLDQYFIFNDVFSMYNPTMKIHEIDISTYSTSDIYTAYDTDTSSSGTLTFTLPSSYTETFRYGDVKEYVEYLSKLYEVKGLEGLDDDDYVALPKSFTRSSETNLPTNAATPPINPPNLKLKQYEDDILTGFLDVGSFEREPLSTGDGDLSIAFSIRNLDGGTIMSTGAEIEGETGIYISVDKEANSSTKPISPFEYNLHIEIKSTNYRYQFAENLNYFENDMTHNFGFGLFRPVASMQRPITLNYSLDISLYNEIDGLLTDIGNPDDTSPSTSTWDKYYTDSSGVKNLRSELQGAYEPSVSHPYIDDSTPPSSGTNPYVPKTKTLNWSDFNWTNILISKRESLEFVKVPISGDDKNTWEIILDENGNKITTYLDAKIWLLNNFEDAINEVGGWSGNITTRPLEFQRGLLIDDIKDLKLQLNEAGTGLNVLNLNLRYYDDSQTLFNINFDNDEFTNNDIGDGTENVNLWVQLGTDGEIVQIHLLNETGIDPVDCVKVGSFKPVTDKNLFIFDFTQSLDICYGVPNNFVDVFASYKNDHDEIKYIYLGRTFGERKDHEEGSNTNLFVGKGNLSTKPYFKGHLKDLGVWYKYLNPISAVTTELDSSTTPITSFDEIDHIWTHGDTTTHQIEYDTTNLKIDSNGGFELTNGSLDFTGVIDRLMYSNVYYVINYNRTQYLSDLALNVKTTKWTKYPFKISYNTDNRFPSLAWYNRGKTDFSSEAIPKEKVVQYEGYRSWQAKVLLKL
jgi:hypothetical protein